MNEYTITFSEEMGSPESSSTITLSQAIINDLLDSFALPAAVQAAEDTSERTVVLGTVEVIPNNPPMWHQQIIEPEVFADMLGSAIVMAAIKAAKEAIAHESPDTDARADT